MAAFLGEITHIYEPPPIPPALESPIGPYLVVRGFDLGALVVVENAAQTPTGSKLRTLTGYVVRQLRFLYRQIWPAHGQRFPQ